MGLDNLKKKKWFSIIANMYVLVLTVFVVWMLFFDTNSLLIHRELKGEVDKLKKNIDFLESEISKDRKIIKKLSSKEELEKIC